jgi:alkylhydroperoxidase family enzyme
MEQDDALLAPTDRAAVSFARKLTRRPRAVRGADFAALRTALGSDREAFETLLHTGAVNFANRFTGGLRLPAEAEAMAVYRDIFGELRGDPRSSR